MRRVIIFIYLFSISSCCNNNHETTVLSNDETINAWIAGNMETYYLWNDRIDFTKINKNENPAIFFKKTIIPDDKYSYILNDFKSLLHKWSENQKSGYAYLLYSGATDSVYGKITYTVKDSPANKAGLKRGMIFIKINGVNLTASNYNDLIEQIDYKHSLTVKNKNNSKTDYDVEVTEFAENPIFLDTVYNLTGHKTGYLIYNAFISDNGDLSKKYDMQLNDIFERFKNENINELILDLRYNQKGNVFSSMILASMIIPDRNVGAIYAKYQYNKSLQAILLNKFGNDYLDLYFTETLNNKPINNIGNQLNRVFILTSPKTGTIGEILINGLKPFIDVVIVGCKTAGNNVFSIFMYEENPELQRINQWAIVPVVMQIANKTGNIDCSFKPFIDIAEPLGDNASLGDINETLLSATLNTIAGINSQSPISTPENAAYKIISQHILLTHLYNCFSTTK